MKVCLDEGAFPPVRAHDTDAGMDIMTKEDVIVPANGGVIVHTGVHVQLPKNTAGLLVSKSGLNIIHDVTSTGLIDEGYTGEIVVKLYNHGTRPYSFAAGQKITQLVIIPALYETVELVDNLDKAERGDAGFGSTGL